MEKSSYKKLKQSKLIVFLGFLLSSSLLVYHPFEELEASPNPNRFNTISLFLTLLVYAYSFAMYTFTNDCYLMLELSEYILVPFSAFCFSQQLRLAKNLENYSNFAHFFSILCFTIILLLSLIKIFYINQIFPGRDTQKILCFSLIPRIFRILKLVVGCICSSIIEENEFVLVLTFLNIVDLLICFEFVSFIDFDNQKSSMFGSLNNLLSLGVFVFLKKDYSLFALALPQISLTMVFLIFQNPIRRALQFKYSLILGNSKLNFNIFNEEEDKKTFFIFLSCFHHIFDFKGERMAIKHSKEDNYSSSFILDLKSKYMKYLNFYLQEQGCNNLMDDLYSEAYSTKVMSEKGKGKQKYHHVGDQLEKQLVKKYSKKYGQKRKCTQILSDTVIFADFILFCLDKFEIQDGDRVHWNYYDEFLLVLMSDFNQNIVIKGIKKSLNHSASKENLLERVRNRKWRAFLELSQLKNQITGCQTQAYLNFYKSVDELRVTTFLEACAQELKFCDGLSKPFHSIFAFNQLLQQREKLKNKIFAALNQCFEDEFYEHCEQFIYIFLLFMVIFCKSINITAQTIQRKFLDCTKLLDNVKSQSKIHNIEEMKAKSLAVCCGMKTKKHKLGDFIISNRSFHKKFGLFKQKHSDGKQSVSDLLFDRNQKQAHFNLMQEKLNFSSSSQKGDSADNHQRYNCFLRTNFFDQPIPVFKQFSIKTMIFYALTQDYFSFICQINEIKQNLYVHVNDLKSIQGKLSEQNLNISTSNQFIQSQLQTEMTLMSVDSALLSKCGIESCLGNFQFQESQNSNPYPHFKEESINSEEIKMLKIETSLWEKKAQSQWPTIRNAILCVFFLFLGAVTPQVSVSLSFHFAKQTTEYVKDYDETISMAQGSAIRYSWSLYLLRKVAEGKIGNSFPPLINNFEEYLKKDMQTVSDNRIHKYFQKIFEEVRPMIFTDTELIDLFDFTNTVSSLSTSQNDYSNFLQNMRVQSQQIIKSDLNQLQGRSKIEFNSFIRQNSLVGDGSFSARFINDVADNKLRFLRKIRSNGNAILLMGTIFCAFFFVTGMWLLILVFLRIMQILSLLTKFDENFIRQKTEEVKFISSQLCQLSHFYFKTCTFNSKQNVHFSTQNVHETSNVDLSLSNFNTLVQNIEDESDKSSNKKIYDVSVWNTLLGKKFFFFSIIAVGVFCGVYISLMGSACMSSIQNNEKTVEIIRQGGMMKQRLASLHLMNWMIYFNDTEIYSNEDKYRYFEAAYDFIQAQRFFLIFYQILDREMLNETSYLTVCEALSKAKIKKQQCNSHISGQLEMLRVQEFISLIGSIENLMYIAMRNGTVNKKHESQMVLNMDTSLNIIAPGIVANYKILAGSINVSNWNILSNSTSSYIIVITACGIWMILAMKMILDSLFLAKCQVLTMDTSKDLLSHKEFKSELNSLFFNSLE